MKTTTSLVACALIYLVLPKQAHQPYPAKENLTSLFSTAKDIIHFSDLAHKTMLELPSQNVPRQKTLPIQGFWRLRAIKVNGLSAKIHNRSKECTWFFQKGGYPDSANTICVRMANQLFYGVVLVKPRLFPKQISIQFFEKGGTFPSRDGIYKMSGQKLYICFSFNGMRPANFSGKQTIMYILERTTNEKGKAALSKRPIRDDYNIPFQGNWEITKWSHSKFNIVERLKQIDYMAKPRLLVRGRSLKTSTNCIVWFGLINNIARKGASNIIRMNIACELGLIRPDLPKVNLRFNLNEGKLYLSTPTSNNYANLTLRRLKAKAKGAAK